MATVSEVRMCDTCLVSGRSVAPLGSLRHVFVALTDCAVDTERLFACWECVALLRRAARFRLRAAHVQLCLQTGDPLDSLDVESGSSLCAVGPVADIHINPETEDEQLTDIKCEYNSDNDCDLDSLFSVEDIFEEQMLNRDIKTENKDSVDLKCEFDNVKSTNYADVSTTTNLKEGENKYSSVKLSTKEIQEHLEEKRKSSAFINAVYKCVKCAIILHKKTYRKHLSLHKNTHKHICHVCKIRVRTESMLQKHLEKHYLQYKCSHCPYTTRSIYVIRDHKCKENLESNTSREEVERKDDTNNSSGSTYKSDPFEETLQNHRDMIEHSRSHDITEFSCTECDFSTESDKILETHSQEAHRHTQGHIAEYREVTESKSTTEPTLTCEICDKPFISAKFLQEHINKYHTVGTGKARGRPNTLSSVMKVSEEDMWKYREREANSLIFKNADWKCEKCIMIFYNEPIFKQHEKLHLRKLKFTCNICSMPINTLKALGKHKQTHYSLHKCAQCDHSSLQKISRSHLECHNKPNRSFQCTICEKSFQEWTERNAHEKEHTDNDISEDTVYVCDKCSMRFKSKKRMKRHLLAHAGDRKIYECPVCPHGASTKYYLSVHYKRKHLMAPVLSEVYCIPCKKQFLTEETYKIHITAHNKEKKKFPCTTCGKDFSSRSILKNHNEFFHLKQRNFVCKFCSKNLYSKSSLKMHIKYVHEGFRMPKTHMCTICNQGFSTRKILVHHVRTHTGERPYKCEYCTASFAQQYAMKTHIRKIHLKHAANQQI